MPFPTRALATSLVALGLHAMPALGAGRMGTPTPVALGAEDFGFQYWQNFEPWEQADCKHKKADDFYDWDVACDVAGRTHVYTVHLVVHFYNQTIHGKSAYEILYWVTDRTDPNAPKFSSSTIWVHNSTEENRMRVLEVGQGVENDFASLRLNLRPR